ncbi:MAG: dihydroorotate dehydrogenase electron transfer subunit [Candidatus Omnitrophota bacterium]
MKRQGRAKIVSNKEIAPQRFLMRCMEPSISKAAKPGQFLMVKCSSGPEPFLRRPFAFHSINNRRFDILYQVVGPGTEALSHRKKGEDLDIIGPIGNGFAESNHRKHNILIAGGIGVAPLLALAEKLAQTANRKPQTALNVVLGASTKSHILREKEFKKAGAKVYVATEDGSKGHKGLATDILKKLLRTSDSGLRTVYACGPKAMLKEVDRLARQHGIHCETSLEEKMACGTGICLGCAIKTTTGTKLVCKDGPVFKAKDIVW